MVAYRSTATATNPATTSASSITITKPSGTVDGDYMVLVTNAAEAAVVTAPAGWILLESAVVTGSGISSSLYMKKAASEGANYVVSFSGGATSCSGSITTFSGTAGIDTWFWADNGSIDPSFGTNIVPSRTALGYHILVWTDTTIDTGTAAGSFTELFDVGQFNTGSTIVRGMAGYRSNATVTAGASITYPSIDMTNSITASTQWVVAMADVVPTNESWASTGIAVEMNINGTWTDVTNDVRYDQSVAITRGTDTQGGQVNPSTATFTLDNRSGNYSTENPNSSYYGYLNYNTQCRISKAYGTVAMVTPGYDDQKKSASRPVDRFRALSTSAMNVTGDLDVRVDCEPETWKQSQVLMAKHNIVPLGGPGNTLSSWIFYLDSEGIPHLYWMENVGGLNLTHNIKATSVVPSNIRQAIRVTLDINNGASGNTVAFYTSDTISGSWTQLGTSVITSGVTTINFSDSALTIGATEPLLDTAFVYDQEAANSSPQPGTFTGRVYAAQLLNGIAGSALANPDFTAQTTGSYSFTDAAGNLWIGYNNAVCSNRRYRHHGEITAWPQTKDTSNNEAWVDIESSGVLQREQQGDNPVSSALYRFYTNPEGIYQTSPGPYSNFGSQGPFYPIGYWPLEDETAALQVASGLTLGTPGKVKGVPTFADNDSFDSSKAIINLKASSSITFPVNAPNSGSFAVEFLLYPPSGITNGAVIARFITTGADKIIELVYSGTNQMTLNTYDVNHTLIHTSGAFTSHTFSSPHNRYSLFAWTTNGTIELYEENISAGIATNISLFSMATSGNVGKLTSIILNPNGTMDGVYMGHVAVFDGTSSDTYPYGSGYDYIPPFDALLGTPGELSAARAKRIVQQADMVPYSIGDNGVALGVQHVSTLMDSVRDSQKSDGGFVYEPRNILGLGYRTLKSMYNAPAILSLNYATADLSGTFLPVKDNLGVVNDLTVHRVDGSSSRYVQTTGRLSVSRPPTGIGRYSSSIDLSLDTDDQTASQASWRVFLGTLNKLKVNQLTIALENARISATADKITRFYSADIGDSISISNLPASIQPDQMLQQIVGYSEVFDQFQHMITFNTIPGEGYAIGTDTAAATSATQSKADSTSTTLAGTMTTTSTSRTVTIASGSALWTTSGVAFDIIVSGERMTVTAVSGSSSPQTFTVTRSVNGVVKTHASGETVSLFKPAITAL